MTGQTANVALLGDDPIEGEQILDGPFMMDTPERIVQAKRGFLSCETGQFDDVQF